ncbi:MAG: nucleotide exchange factor GrpE [Actinomycetia bacterium]|nr:nucleotide exchange factor GrpE [Actinomycetes bacterium]
MSQERHDATESGVTDEVTPDQGPDDAGAAEAGAGDDDAVNTEAVNDPVDHDAAAAAPATDASAPADTHPDTTLAAERLADLQRLQAEYVNYKRRVDRDRAAHQEQAVAGVLESLLPVLDDIHAAREHDQLSGPFASIADKLEGNLGKYGLERFGAPGEPFDPQIHEALLHQEWDGSIEPADADATTIVMVLQPGYRAGERVIRAARVAVADPA